MNVLKKNPLVIAAAALLVLTAAGCGSSSKTVRLDPMFPDWYADVQPADAVWGVGSARIPKNASDPSMTLTTAQNRALVSIARQLDTNIQAMFVDYQQVAGTDAAPQLLNFQQNVSRNITNMRLAGAQQNAGPTIIGDVIWVRYTVSKNEAREALDSLIQNEAAQYSEFKADQALKMLDAQLDKQQKPVPVTE